MNTHKQNTSGKPTPLHPYLLPALLAVTALLGWLIYRQVTRAEFEKEQVTASTAVVSFVDKDTSINAELADNSTKRARGLMGRSFLDENDGMLFVFDDEDFRTFWMKDTLISLDIIFINSDLVVVNISENTTPMDTQKIYSSDEKVKYVLEVNGGWSEKNEIKKGDKIEISGI